VNLVWAIESLHRGWQRDEGGSPNVERRKKRITEILSRFFGEGDKKLREWLAGKLKYAHEPKLEDRIVESFQREFSAKLRVLSASLASRDGWLILGGFAVKGAWVGEAGWLAD
jgi:hypothetical protein